MFGVEHPIICGAMMWICKPPLCAAIFNAGGLGNLKSGNYETEEDFRDAIAQTRKFTIEKGDKWHWRRCWRFRI